MWCNRGTYVPNRPDQPGMILQGKGRGEDLENSALRNRDISDQTRGLSETDPKVLDYLKNLCHICP